MNSAVRAAGEPLTRVPSRKDPPARPTARVCRGSAATVVPSAPGSQMRQVRHHGDRPIVSCCRHGHDSRPQSQDQQHDELQSVGIGVRLDHDRPRPTAEQVRGARLDPGIL